jgi:hypothetical protein
MLAEGGTRPFMVTFLADGNSPSGWTNPETLATRQDSSGVEVLRAATLDCALLRLSDKNGPRDGKVTENEDG